MTMRMAKFFLFVLAVTLLLPVCALAGTTVPGTFGTIDGVTIGGAPNAKYAWVSVDAAKKETIQIRGAELVIDYQEGPSPAPAANIAGYTAADMDISLEVYLERGDKTRLCGIAYRLESPDSGFQSRGYCAFIEAAAVTLVYEQKVLAQARLETSPKAFHKVRVVAVGNSHKVYVDDKLCLDTRDENRVGPGSVGVQIHYQQARFKEFAIKTLSATATATVQPAERRVPPDAAPGSIPALGIYPQGKLFPLGLYGVSQAADLKEVQKWGWNFVQAYDGGMALPAACAKAGILCMADIPGQGLLTACAPLPEEEVAKIIKEKSASDYFAWWEFPEERRFWIEEENLIVPFYFHYTRKYDPQRRPTYMYMPGNYESTSVAMYVPYLDILCASVYPTYANMPHAWVRWRMESTVNAVRLGGGYVGPDYLHGNRTPVGVLELFYYRKPVGQTPTRVLTPAGAYHDFWQCIVSGAKGIIIFSYAHRTDIPEFGSVWQAYCKAASEISGAEQLGQVVLWGKKFDGASCRITAGPTKTVEFVPNGTALAPICYPSVDVLCMTWQGNTYVFAVNSSEAEATARIEGLPRKAATARELSEDKTVSMKDGSVELHFAPLGVRILKVAGTL